MNKMQVVIVAGGKGERLKPLTNFVPKPMVKVGDKPILEHILDLFKKYGFVNFIFCLCYLPDVITNYFGDGRKFGVKIKYTFEDPNNPLGTAGAVSLSRKMIKDTFVVTSGDILREINIKSMITKHKAEKAFTTINIYKRYGPDPKSKIEMDKNYNILNFKERPSKEELTEDFVWANGFLFCLEPEIFDFIPSGKSVDFGKDVFPEVLKSKKKVIAFPSNGYFIDISNLEKLEKARQTYLPKI